MKKYIISTLLLLVTLLYSCDEFLKEELVSNVSASSYYTTVAGLEDAVDATYYWMKPFFSTERGGTMTIFGTDIHTNGADGGHKAVNRYDGGLNESESYMRETWRDFYKGVNQANAVLNRAQNIDMDEDLRIQRFAEVRFLRGLFYFMLTRFYGDIHLSLEETEGVEITANKTPASQIYSEAIIPDLEFAIANLPDEQSDFGRATKPAAEYLLGQVLLRRSYTSFAEANDASRAETLFSNVINNYGFELATDMRELFGLDEYGRASGIPANESSSEIIFQVISNKAQVDEGLDGDGNKFHLYFLMEYDKLPGMTRDVANGRPWKRFRPTEFSLGLWDRTIDSRYDLTYKHVWFSNNESSIPAWTADDAANGYCDASQVDQPKFLLGDTAIFIPGPDVEDKFIADPTLEAKAPYIVYTNDEYTERVYPTLNKHIDDTRPDRQKEQGQRDFIMMRLGEAYLLRAEARLKQDNTSGAADDINVIRRRAAWPGMEDQMEITEADVTLDFLLDERARELDGEGQRWFALTRTGKLVERVRLYNPEAAPNIQNYHVVRPIPLDQIDRTQGGYPQNSGYPGAE